MFYNKNMFTEKPFLKNYNVSEFFIERKEKELSLTRIGYHNLRFIRPHKFFRTQTFYTLHIVLSGKGTLHYRGNTYAIGENSVFVLPNDEPFCYYADEQDPWEYIFFELTGTSLCDYLRSVGFSDASPVRHFPVPEKILGEYRDFFLKKENALPCSYYDAVSLFFLLLGALAETSNPQPLRQEDLIQQAKYLLRSHYHDPNFSLDLVADSLHISHAQLCRLFKKQTGETMIAFLNRLRMDYAKKMLIESDKNATEICYAAGYQDYTYFLTLFKKYHGMTTNEYRRLHQKN